METKEYVQNIQVYSYLMSLMELVVFFCINLNILYIILNIFESVNDSKYLGTKTIWMQMNLNISIKSIIIRTKADWVGFTIN